MRLYLVRHGKAAASFSESHDPGLHPSGVAQAEAVAERLAPLGPLPLVVSPLRRTRETAAPLERRWGVAGRIEPAVGEIPSPCAEPARRGEWLRGVMTSRWAEQPAELHRWRDGVLEALLRLPESSVIVSHFVAINVAVGSATEDDRVISFAPDNGSVTVLGLVGGALRLLERGVEAATRVL